MNRWVVVGLLIATGCKNAPSEDQCKQLLEHLVDLEFKNGGATASDALKADIAKQKQEVAKAKPEFISMCVDKTAKERIACALQAQDLDAVAKCDVAK